MDRNRRAARNKLFIDYLNYFVHLQKYSCNAEKPTLSVLIIETLIRNIELDQDFEEYFEIEGSLIPEEVLANAEAECLALYKNSIIRRDSSLNQVTIEIARKLFSAMYRKNISLDKLICSL